jgi:hypothetical protein
MRLLHFSMILGLSATLAMSGCKKDDPCDDVTCLNGGTCNDGTCSCQSGYEGSTCGTEVRAKFLGYTMACSCPSGNLKLPSTMTTSQQCGNRVIISIVLRWVDGVSATLVRQVPRSPSPPSKWTLEATTISGTGQLSGSILTISYNLQVAVPRAVLTQVPNSDPTYRRISKKERPLGRSFFVRHVVTARGHGDTLGGVAEPNSFRIPYFRGPNIRIQASWHPRPT